MSHNASSAHPSHTTHRRASTNSAGAASSLSATPHEIDSSTLERLEAILHSLQRAPVQDQAIRLPEVLSIVGISKSTWYARLNPRLPSHDPRVPKPFKLGTSGRSPSVWWRSEVMAYVHSCANAHAKY